ncbi:MAG: DUF1232 domain-containing protein [Deferribacteraceae bacterium]|nr:DUF1232 domain-containing protein [Deferribacteraceae bacterium]
MLKDRAKRLKADLPMVFLALRHKDTPLAAKLVAGLAVVYALSPIDLIPDFIPVLGLLDDIIILPLLIALAIKLIPQVVLDECRSEAANIWASGKPKRWRYAILIVAIWLVMVGGICLQIVRRYGEGGI